MQSCSTYGAGFHAYEKGFLQVAVSTAYRKPKKLTFSDLLQLAGLTISSLLYYLYFFSACMFWVVLTTCVGALLLPLDKEGRVVHHLTCALGYHLVAINPRWRCRFENMELLDRNKTYVFVANHQSMADPLVLSGLRARYKWIAKAPIFKIPGVGLLMRINRYICVEHGSVKSVRSMIVAGRRFLSQGLSVFIFPEGTRSEDGNLMQFKDGPFKLACDTDTPVLPVVLEGTRYLLPRGRWILNFDTEITVRVLPPVYPVEFGLDPSSLRRYVRSLIETELQSIRQEASQRAPAGVRPHIAVPILQPIQIIGSDGVERPA